MPLEGIEELTGSPVPTVELPSSEVRRGRQPEVQQHCRLGVRSASLLSGFVVQKKACSQFGGVG